jgi:hypothetical protein
VLPAPSRASPTAHGSGGDGNYRGTQDEQVVDGEHRPLVAPEDFDRLRRLRHDRDLSGGKHTTGGRPAQNHALAKLAVCGKCYERMYAVTSRYRRKDGSRRRTYACHNYHFGTGECDPAAHRRRAGGPGSRRRTRQAAGGLQGVARAD